MLSIGLLPSVSFFSSSLRSSQENAIKRNRDSDKKEEDVIYYYNQPYYNDTNQNQQQAYINQQDYQQQISQTAHKNQQNFEQKQTYFPQYQQQNNQQYIITMQSMNIINNNKQRGLNYNANKPYKYSPVYEEVQGTTEIINDGSGIILKAPNQLQTRSITKIHHTQAQNQVNNTLPGDESKHYQMLPFSVGNKGISEELISLNDIKTAENLRCQICLNLVFDPIKCMNCDQIFCRICLSNVVKKTGSCPNGCQFIPMELDRIVKNILDNLEIKCINKDCKERVHYSDLVEHYYKCKESYYYCTNKGCSFKGKIVDIEKHYDKCQYKHVQCEYCHCILRKMDVKPHIQVYCPNVDVICGLCNQTFKRKFYLEAHYSESNQNVNCLQKQIENLKSENLKLKEENQKLKYKKNEGLDKGDNNVKVKEEKSKNEDVNLSREKTEISKGESNE